MKKITFLTFLLISCIAFTQTNSTGPIEFLPISSGTPYGAQIDVTATEVTLTLAGPADRWLGIGFDVTSMSNGEDVVIYSGGSALDTSGTLSDRTFNGIGSTPSLDSGQDWTLVTNDITTQPGGRILVATRALNTGVDNDHVFSISDTSINLVWAMGNGSLFLGNHGNSNRGIEPAVGYTLGVNDFELSQFKIVPNPVTSEFNIELPNAVNNAEVEVFDVLGKTIYKTEISNFNSKINAANWNNGIYMVKVSSGNSSKTKRLIKQ